MDVGYAAKSDAGLKRTKNEDHFGVDPGLGLYVVCDGMGGQNAGEVASQLAVTTIRQHCWEASQDQNVEMLGIYDPAFLPPTNRLASAVRHANDAIHRKAEDDLRYHGMGTTVVCALVKDHVLSIAHVGDSRLYVIRGDTVQLLTSDHSLVMEQIREGLLTEQEAERSPHKHVLTRALGIAPTVEVELGEVPVLSGDIFLLCSDGLTRMVTQADIVRAVRQAGDLQAASERLIEIANASGGDDNTTVILIAVQDAPRRKFWQRIRHRIVGEHDIVSTEREETSWRS